MWPVAGALIAFCLFATNLEASGQQQVAQMKVFLDCEDCYVDFLQSEIEFVDYVRDRTEAEVHVLITRAQTASGGTEYTLSFIGRGRFDGTTETFKTVTENSDTDDTSGGSWRRPSGLACCDS